MEYRLAKIGIVMAVGATLLAGSRAKAGSEYANQGKREVAPALKFTMPDIDGKPVKLARYQGDVILIVNVASRCGYTPQYKSIEKLYEQYKDKGFTVLGFPANEFRQQEPGTNEEIKKFCTDNYHVAFPMFSKIVVKGDGQAPLYKFLTSKESNPNFGGDIEWNFTKFLVNRKGEVVARFKTNIDPLTPSVVAEIEKQLAEPRK